MRLAVCVCGAVNIPPLLNMAGDDGSADALRTWLWYVGSVGWDAKDDE